MDIKVPYSVLFALELCWSWV